MSYTAEGTIEIPTEEFFSWVRRHYCPGPTRTGSNVQYGAPRVNKSNKTIEVDFAMGDDCSPAEWLVKPDCVREWEEPV